MTEFIISHEYLYSVEPSGRKARILSKDGPVDAPIVALIRLAGEAEDLKGREMIMCFNLEGQSTTGHKLILEERK